MKLDDYKNYELIDELIRREKAIVMEVIIYADYEVTLKAFSKKEYGRKESYERVETYSDRGKAKILIYK